ncbi:hypothetical protein [Legionella feeleii]|uniref:Uncharacterized protein n=1 Tax=Legionella feeleii TaxID=453 RepID=A0A0W0TM69_9GAMM|nr:hypothetical protein [Legionella feeleii]KTC96708.1 hypothetical protein Lfee_1620 [Legionella feeleii]SPX60621.1 Uncharacterised protein [Legionella feeleii]
MHDNIISTLLSPITLLFLVNAFFLIFVTSFVWTIFLNVKFTNSLFHSFKANNRAPLLLKAVLFFPLVLIAFIAEYQWSVLTQANFFPLAGSSFVRLNAIGLLISVIALIVIKNLDKKMEVETYRIPLFIMTYLIVLYLFYLILLMATVITRLNAFPDGFLRNYSFPAAQKINEYVLFGLFLIHWLVVFVTVSCQTTQRILFFLAYTIILALAYSIVF